MKIKLFSPQAIYELGKRTGQEDAIFPKIGEASELDSLFIVCDGMGGHEKGEVASNTVAQAMADYIFQNTSPEEPFSDQLFQQTLEEAYRQLDQIDDGSAKKPGTTLTFLYFHRNGCTVAHIGDSRIYHVRPEERRVLYQSRDHSVVYDLYLAGEIEYDEMGKQPNKNIITKAMMPGSGARQKANITHIADIRPDDYFYLCSDGMLERMTNDEIVDILASDMTDEQKRQRLIQATADNHDNHSAYIIHIDEVTRERRDKDLPDNEAAMMAKAFRREDSADDGIVEEPRPDKRVAAVRQQSTRQSAPQPPRPGRRDATTTSHGQPARRSLLVPVITTAALLLILAGVYFTCSGRDEKPKTEVIADPVDEKVEKPVKDTMNIVGGETPSNALPTPTDGLQLPEQKKPEEKKSEEKKDEAGSPDGGNTTSVHDTGVTSNEGGEVPDAPQQQQQSADTPEASSAVPSASATPPATPDSPQPPAQSGPRSVIPDE